MNLGEKTVVQILGEKQILQADWPTTNAKLASTVTKFCKNKSSNDQIIKKVRIRYSHNIQSRKFKSSNI